MSNLETLLHFYHQSLLPRGTSGGRVITCIPCLEQGNDITHIDVPKPVTLSQGPGSGHCDRKCSKDKDAEWGAMALPFSSWFPLVTILDLSWSWCLHQLQYGHHCGVVLGKGSRHLFIVLTRSVSVGRQGGTSPDQRRHP